MVPTIGGRKEQSEQGLTWANSMRNGLGDSRVWHGTASLSRSGAVSSIDGNLEPAFTPVFRD